MLKKDVMMLNRQTNVWLKDVSYDRENAKLG